jgi:hypothetical protein
MSEALNNCSNHHVASRTSTRRYDRIPDSADRLLDACQAVMRISRKLHVAPEGSEVRQSILITSLCQLLNAHDGMIKVTRTEPASGRQTVVSVVRASKDSAPPNYDRDPSGNGPCHEAFLSISGVRLVSRLTLNRQPGAPRFTSAERALADLVHAESAWIYSDTESGALDSRGGD